jgi:hypothetical protein
MPVCNQLTGIRWRKPGKAGRAGRRLGDDRLASQPAVAEAESLDFYCSEAKVEEKVAYLFMADCGGQATRPKRGLQPKALKYNVIDTIRDSQPIPTQGSSPRAIPALSSVMVKKDQSPSRCGRRVLQKSMGLRWPRHPRCTVIANPREVAVGHTQRQPSRLRDAASFCWRPVAPIVVD